MHTKLLYISKRINDSATGGTRRILGTINLVSSIENIECSVLTESTLGLKNVNLLKSPRIIKDKPEILSPRNFNTVAKLKIINKNYISFMPMGFLKIAFRKFDILYCTCPVFANLQLGYFYKLLYPKCQLILEYRDLNSFNPQYHENFSVKLAQYFEKKLLRKADTVITTTKGMEKKLKKYIDSKKISIVYNFISISDYVEANKLDGLVLNSDYYNIGYVGTLKNGRHPKIILELLKMKIENKLTMLHFVGISNLQETFILENAFAEYKKRINFYGIVDRMTSLRIMKSMDSLFILINPECKVSEGFGIPGKLFDYIAMNNKILTNIDTFNKLIDEIDIEKIFTVDDYIQFRSLTNNFLDNELIQIFKNITL